MVSRKNDKTTIDEKLLSSLKDEYKLNSNSIPDVDIMESLLEKRISQLTENGKNALTNVQIDTLNKFIQYHNSTIKPFEGEKVSENAQFYRYAVAQDSNSNVFLLNASMSEGKKITYNGTDTGTWEKVVNFVTNPIDSFRTEKNLEELKKAAISAVFDGIVSKDDKEKLKALSVENNEYDISVITRKGVTSVIIHSQDDPQKEAKAGEFLNGVKMVASTKAEGIPASDSYYYLEVKAEKTRRDIESGKIKDPREI